MGRKKKIDSKEAGLEIGLHLFKFFFKSEYLHYGLFTDGMKADVQNLYQAQENYTQFLLSNIPAGVKTILDVGCGSGKIAETLLNKGYKVDCVSPGNLLTKYVMNKIGSRIEMFNSRFQDVQTDKRYDMVLFSESFQYMPFKDSMSGAAKYLNKGGHVMISDFFKTDAEGKSLLGGGLPYNEWLEAKKLFPFTIIKEQDITQETSKTIDIVNELSQEVLLPTWRVVFMLAEDRFPTLMKLVKWKYKKKLDKMETKHLSGERNGANFIKYKKYMFYLMKKND
jgi:cyclopropane fatty-acyl-phospholipid synthase-like methyltransferase